MANPTDRAFPTEVLVVSDSFDAMIGATDAGEALVRGLVASGQPAQVATLADPDYAVKMRAARALVTGMGRLTRDCLAGTTLSEVATRARQAGVPCHAVVGSSSLDLFELRMLDLQIVLEAGTLPELEAAGARLGAAIQAEFALGS